jgi:dUTP pyrophosphatase
MGKHSLRYRLSDEAKEAGCKFHAPRWGDAGYDIRAARPTTIFRGEQVLVATGLFLAVPEGHVGLLRDRSSMALKKIRVYAGVIDSSYRGEVLVLLQFDGDGNYHIEPGDKIAQLLVVPTASALAVMETPNLDATTRGDAGFGSTGR